MSPGTELNQTVAGAQRGAARILDSIDDADRRFLTELRSDPAIEVVDLGAQQLATASELLDGPDPERVAASRYWAYYPWRRAVVAVLDPQTFRRTRFDRNRNLITSAEQDRLGQLRVGIVGLSVGHAVAHLLAMEGVCGELRLADFDALELTNLNRVPATVFDLGVNKATAAARRIAELDPYLPVRAFTSGLTEDTIDIFLDGLDIVVEECDSLDMKLTVRQAARARGLPVLMATSDHGLVDVERFDLEPQRPILHGLLGDIDVTALAGLPSKDKVPYVLSILEAGRLSARGAASMVEVGRTLSTWPQLASEVTLGAATIAKAVRRIGLGEPLPSGRVRIDVDDALERLTAPVPKPAGQPQSSVEAPIPHDATEDTDDAVARVAAAVLRAPSAGNAQPWDIETGPDSITLRLDRERTSLLDLAFRASTVALGAAVYNARVAAAAAGASVSTEFVADPTAPLRAVIRLAEGVDEDLAAFYRPMLARETNRRRGTAGPIHDDTAALLTASATREGARLHLLTAKADIEAAATIIAATDRIRYLTPQLHAEMLAELRWPGDPDPDTGIEVSAMELDPSQLAVLDILRRPDVMATLTDWDAGDALGDYTRERIRASSALAVVTVDGREPTDYLRGGSALEAVWVRAQQRGLAVHPVSPLFLYAHEDAELKALSPHFASSLVRLRREFRDLAGTGADESQIIVLRLFEAPPASVRSRRRPGDVRAN
ncbi:Rv1355c family protein [Mycolicibacterium thermoresistibile]